MRSAILFFLFAVSGVPVRGQQAAAAADAVPPAVAPAASSKAPESILIGDGKFRFSVDTSKAPDLAPWVNDALIPVLKEWYPKIVALLPGKDYEAPRSFSIVFDPAYTGVAATTGTLVVCNPEWYRKELKGEARGSVVHELVHVVQQYGRRRAPGWLTEGIADYIRWYLYEPESKGCEIPPGAADRVRHDQSYRVSANFLNWVVTHHDKDLVRELNAALREGRYNPMLWVERTQMDLPSLEIAWRKNIGMGEAGEAAGRQ